MAGKIEATQIEITRAEGPSALCGTVTITKRFEECDVWALADLTLAGWALTAPADRAYDKCDFTITFADGEEYAGRFDLGRHNESLRAHVRDFATYHAKPENINAIGFKSLDADALAAQYRQLLDTYAIA